jgi:hypothetical protein
MANRTVTDSAGRTWSCAALEGIEGVTTQQGKDVVLSCETASVSKPVSVTVGWQWEAMAANGLARIVNLASPVPRA